MPGEYQDRNAVEQFLVIRLRPFWASAQFVNNSIMCIGNIPDGTSKRSTWRQALCFKIVSNASKRLELARVLGSLEHGRHGLSTWQFRPVQAPPR